MSEKTSYPEEIDLRDLFLILYKKRWFILVITFLFFILSVVFWYVKNKELEKEQILIIKLPELVLKDIPFPSVTFPDIRNRNFFSTSIEPVIKKNVKVRVISALKENFLAGIEMTGTAQQLEKALQSLESKIIKSVMEVFEQEALSYSVKVKLLKGKIEEKKEAISRLERELKALEKARLEFKTAGQDSLIVLSPELIPYLDWKIQIRGLQSKLLKTQLEIEDLREDIELYTKKKELIERILNRKKDYQQKEIFNASHFCQVLKKELYGKKTEGVLLAHVYYMKSYADFLCNQLKQLKKPFSVRHRNFSKSIILVVTVLGFFMAVFLSFLVEFLQNLNLKG